MPVSACLSMTVSRSKYECLNQPVEVKVCFGVAWGFFDSPTSPITRVQPGLEEC